METQEHNQPIPLVERTPDSQGGAHADALQARQRLDCLLEVARVVNSSLELDAVLDNVLTHTRRILQAESASIMLLEEGSPELRVVAAHGPRAKQIAGRSRPLGEGVAGWVALHGRPVRLQGRVTETQFSRVSRRRDVRDALCVPLQAEAETIGVVSLNNRLGDGIFTEADLDLLTAIAHQAALAIRNARAFNEMRRQRRTVERLLDELTCAQEEERRRIALLMHDGPAQTLFAALRNLEAARAAVDDPVRAQAAVAVLEENIRHAIRETRALMVDLRPPCLDEIGLAAALRQYAQQFQERSGVRAHVSQRGIPRRLPGVIETCFFRIAQEALTNVWKHAGANCAEVVLQVTEQHCSLEIADDGCGFDPELALLQEGRHLGMASLRERAELVGGSLSVRTAPGKGTSISVGVPLTD